MNTGNGGNPYPLFDLLCVSLVGRENERKEEKRREEKEKEKGEKVF